VVKELSSQAQGDAKESSLFQEERDRKEERKEGLSSSQPVEVRDLKRSS